MVIETVIISEPPLIPVWFYSYSAVVYILSAIVSFLIGYFSFRLYKMSSVKINLKFFFSFLILGFAFSFLAIASIYTYFYVPYFKVFQNLGYINKLGFNLYYLASLVAYVLLFTVYLPKNITKKLFVLYVPLWYTNLQNFHVASLVILAYVILRNITNFVKKRTINSFLVMFAFLAIAAFHTISLLVSFNPTLYLLAHSFLTIGLGSLLVMLIRVSRR